MIKKGDAFWLYDGSNSDDEELLHLYVAISDPNDDDKIMIVNLTSIKKDRYVDYSCTFKENEHKEITQPSFVLYDKACEISCSSLPNAISVYAKRNRNISPFPAKLLKRIQDGAKKTDALKGKFEKYFDFF